ncbi:MAG: hypothetical protein DRP79_06080, partial [Planctomycetota bacterium]
MGARLYWEGTSQHWKVQARSIVTHTDFTLDTVNNRTAVDDTLGAAGTEHDAAYTLNDLHQYSSLTYGGTAYSRSHGSAGNLVDEDTADLTKYAWDYNDKLAARWTDDGAGGGTADNGIIDGTETVHYQYVYDAIGRRVLKDASTDTRYIYNGWQCIEEYEDSGSGFSLKLTRVYGNNIDEVLQVEIGSDKYYFHANVQGNVVALTDDGGTVVETYEYDIYGRLTAAEAWNGSAKVTVRDGDTDGDGDVDGDDDPAYLNDFIDAVELFAVSLIDNEMLFQSRRLDEESELYYFRNRQYDPV